MKSLSLRNNMKVESGVRRGDLLSAQLFIAAIEYTFKRRDIHYLAIDINGRKLNKIEFADNIEFIGKISEKLQLMLDKLREEAAKKRLKINNNKTKLLRINTKKVDGILFNNVIEEEKEFIYLGKILRARAKRYRGESL